MPRSRRERYWLACALALLAAGFIMFFHWFEHISVYHPVRAIRQNPGAAGLAWKDVSINSSGGVTLACWFIDGPSADAPVAIFLHGNSGNISTEMAKGVLLRGMGYAVLMVEYRGFGASTGIPGERGLYDDAVAAFDWTQVNHPGRIVVYGHSLGTGVAVELALRRKPAALVLESPFTSMVAMCKKLFPWLPARILVSQKYDTLSKIAGVGCPLLVIHGENDELIPPAMGRQVYEAAREPRVFALLPGGHDNIYLASGQKYTDTVASFLSKYLRETK